MQALAPHWTIRAGSRTLAVALLLVLVLTPGCSSVCPVHGCRELNAAKQDASCHHDPQNMSGNSLHLRAALASCSSAADLVLALPEVSSKLQADGSILISAGCNSYHSSVAIPPSSSPFHRPLERYFGTALTLRRSVASQFSFDSFVFLRV